MAVRSFFRIDFCATYANGRTGYFAIDFCATYANGRTDLLFGIDLCATYANGRTDFFAIDWKCESTKRDNMAQYAPYKIKHG